jgi:hypothetical protein
MVSQGTRKAATPYRWTLALSNDNDPYFERYLQDAKRATS